MPISPNPGKTSSFLSFRPTYFGSSKNFPTRGPVELAGPRIESDPLPPCESQRDLLQRWKTRDADGCVTTTGYHLATYIRISKLLSCLCPIDYTHWQRVRDSNLCALDLFSLVTREKRLYERPREAAKSGSKRLLTLNFNVKQSILFNMPKPKPTTFEVRKSKPFCGKEWRVTGYVDGKRKQFWYATEKQARAEAAWRNQERSAYGSKVNLDSELRLEAYRANELLKPHNKTILDAVNHYRAHLNTLASSVSFSVLAEKIRTEYKRRRENNETSDRNVETLESTLKKLERRFAAELVCNIRTEDLREWLTALPLAAKTRNTIRGYVRLVFTHAADYGYTPANPALAIKKFRERYNEGEAIGILSAEDTEKLFRAAHPELIPFLTLWFFTGIRRRTLEKLDWSDVRLSEKRIIVPRHHGKNQRRYRVTLSENALEWLKPYEKGSGSLLAISKAPQSRGKPSEERTRDLIVAAAKEVGITLPDNVGRNTFISMHVAYHESIDKTALEADNSSEIIKKDLSGPCYPRRGRKILEYPVRRRAT